MAAGAPALWHMYEDICAADTQDIGAADTQDIGAADTQDIGAADTQDIAAANTGQTISVSIRWADGAGCPDL
jgi:hypothetical protein